ncbi:hypothetical protein CSUB01_00060 [Colletotrichum sublineola]|uniref:Uncharacterized protein n=1 Tax=Colletotrichum sublineola TaxID=1173701 RepID=A0A066XU22_COLSU|nr:hypothetical protein CSUB01_00060 [Colletotrichum sublineola]
MIHTLIYVSPCRGPGRLVRLQAASNLDKPPLPYLLRLDHPGQRQEESADHQTAPGKGLRAEVAASGGGDDGAGDGVAGEHGEGDDGEDHADARALLARVRRQGADAGGEEGLDGVAGDAEEDGPDVEARRGLDGDPAVGQEAREERHGREDGDGPDLVGEEVGPQASDEADAVQDQEQVQRVRVREVELVPAQSFFFLNSLDYSARSDAGPTYKEPSGRVEGVLELLEGGQVHQLARSARRDPRLQEDQAHGQRRELDEAEGAHGPGEADLRQELPDGAREDQAAGGAPDGGDADGQRPLLVKVGRQRGQGRGENEAEAQADADAVGKEDLPVLRAPRGGEDAQEDQEGAAQEEVPEVARVREAAGEGADEEEEKDLERTDPGDIRRRPVQLLDIVRLEDAKGVDEPPA